MWVMILFYLNSDTDPYWDLVVIFFKKGESNKKKQQLYFLIIKFVLRVCKRLSPPSLRCIALPGEGKCVCRSQTIRDYAMTDSRVNTLSRMNIRCTTNRMHLFFFFFEAIVQHATISSTHGRFKQEKNVYTLNLKFFSIIIFRH